MPLPVDGSRTAAVTLPPPLEPAARRACRHRRAWCIVLGRVALSFEHPLLLVALLAIMLAAGAAAQVGREVARAACGRCRSRS